MKTKRFRCKHCKKMRTARVKDQKYCSEKDCQRARKRAWSKVAYAGDPDYRANQRASTDSWLETQGGSAAYFRKYRKRRKNEKAAAQDEPINLVEEEEVSKVETSVFVPEICALGKSANRDAASGENPLKPGRYVMFRDHAQMGANRDAIFVEIAFISSS